jgi:hypothetical protein
MNRLTIPHITSAGKAQEKEKTMNIPSLLRITTSSNKAHRPRRMLLMALLCLAAPIALHAQDTDGGDGWHVTDGTTHDKLDALYNKNKDGVQDIDTHARNIDSNFKIGSYVSPGDRLADPTSVTGAIAGATSNQSPFATATLNDGIDQCSNVAQGQQDNCKEIVQTQNAQYMYMTTAYANTVTRNTALQSLLTERQNIKSGSCSSGATGSGAGGDTSTCIGLLEDNTNKLMALYSLMALDRQQMESANYAYEVRLRYLRNYQARLANAAATGGPTPSSGSSGSSLPIPTGVGNLISNAVAGGVMAVALGTSSVNGPTLGIEKSNGF